VSLQPFESKEIERAYAWLREYWRRPIDPEYHRVSTVQEALSILGAYGRRARILAGGIDFLGLMKSGIESPEALVNIKPVKALEHITLSRDSITIGALTRIRDLERSPIIERQYPILSEAARGIGSPHVRNMATLAGNICQETRCWYFRRPWESGISYACRRKDGGGKCFALDGENQYHGLMGKGDCVAVCPSDMATVFCAMDARIRTEAVGGGRTIQIKDFYSEYGNILNPGEMVTSVQVPRLSPGTEQRFLKFRIRKAIDFAIVSVASIIKMDRKGKVTDSRIVLGGVGYGPYVANGASEVLAGEKITEKAAEKAADASVSALKPLSKNAYKIPILKALVKRAILGQGRSVRFSQGSEAPGVAR